MRTESPAEAPPREPPCGPTRCCLPTTESYACHFQIRAPAGRAHCKNVRLPPSIRRGQPMHVAQQTARFIGNLTPQVTHDIECRLPGMPACGADQIEQR